MSIENELREKGLGVTALQNHPEMLEDLLAGEYDRALFSLQKSKSSGVFMILDATVNAKLENAETSRAGLFIKNMEPNIAPLYLFADGWHSSIRFGGSLLQIVLWQ